MANSTKMRVAVPRNAEEVLKLANAIYTKHKGLGASSPLLMLQDHTWDKLGPQINDALLLHTQGETLRRQMEKAYRDRDLLMANIEHGVKASRDMLTGINRSNMKRMGDWGFTVDDSPRPVKVKAKKKEEEKV